MERREMGRHVPEVFCLGVEGLHVVQVLGVDVQAQVVLDLPAQRPHLIVVKEGG